METIASIYSKIVNDCQNQEDNEFWQATYRTTGDNNFTFVLTVLARGMEQWNSVKNPPETKVSHKEVH
jgi:hypothetical protein